MALEEEEERAKTTAETAGATSSALEIRRVEAEPRHGSQQLRERDIMWTTMV